MKKGVLWGNANPFPVLNYLEGMSREGDEPDNTPPRSMVDPSEYRSKAGSNRVRSPPIHSPAPRSKTSEALLELANSPMSYTNRNGIHAAPNDDDDGDADSNIQDGLRSEAGETILPVVSNSPESMHLSAPTLSQREPGPHDPPGAKYESYGSGPSFGNFGPLPTDDHAAASNNPFAHNTWNVRKLCSMCAVFPTDVTSPIGHRYSPNLQHRAHGKAK